MKLAAFVLAALLCADSQATELQDLLQQDQLRISTWISPGDKIAVGQEVLLTVEIATQRWFAGGTSIRHPEVPGLVILQRDQFATNLSRREAGMTWVVQRWNLELYPQQAGVYDLPPIKLKLAVNHASEGIIRGSLESEPISFRASIPPGLERETNWLATTAFSISQSTEPEPIQLKPGDAVQREVRMEARHLSAMMLPTLTIEDIDGVSAYPDSPELLDRSNRGEATAERIERITYVIEKPGQYILPEQVFYWWNSSQQQLETEILEAVTLDAGAALATRPETREPAGKTRRAALDALLAWWPVLPAVLLCVAAIYLSGRWRASPPGERALLAQAERHLRAGDKEEAVAALYRWLNSAQPAPDWYQLRTAVSRQTHPELQQQIELLLKEVYTGQTTDAGKIRGLVSLRQQRGLTGTIRRWFDRPARLELNPGSNSGE